MFLLHPKKFSILLLSFVLLLFHALADAALIRGRGRGGITVFVGDYFMLVPDAEIDEYGVYRDYAPLLGNSVTTPPTYPMIQSVPDDCFVSLNGSEPEEFIDEPCYWQFNQNERWLLNGSSITYFSNASQNITWQIFDSVSDSIVGEFTNELSSIDDTDPSVVDILFDSQTPVELDPGEYRVRVVMEQSAPDGWQFFTAANGPELTEFCVTGVSGRDDRCYYEGTVNGPTFTRTSIFERLVILPSNTPIEANAPNVAGLVMFALFCIIRNRKALDSKLK